MEYREIFTDIKTQDNLFLRFRVYAPDLNKPLPDQPPYLIQVILGDKGIEDWEIKWILRNGFTSQANVIRQTIKLLDSTPLPANIEDID